MKVAQAIRVLDDVLKDVSDLIKRVGAEARLPDDERSPRRLDVYALITLGSVYELAQGVRSERREQRQANAARLARHLYEFDVETSWIVTDPENRAERRYAEDLRLFLKYGAAPAVDARGVQAAEALIGKVRASLSGKERKDRFQRLMPSQRKMAAERASLEAYDQQYGRLSHLSHPSVASGVKFMRLVDHQGQEVWRPPVDRFDEAHVLSQAAYSAARCLGRLAAFLDVDVEQAVRQHLVTIEGITTSEIEG